MKVFKGCAVGAFWFVVPFLALIIVGSLSFNVKFEEGPGVGVYEWDR